METNKRVKAKGREYDEEKYERKNMNSGRRNEFTGWKRRK